MKGSIEGIDLVLEIGVVMASGEVEDGSPIKGLTRCRFKGHTTLDFSSVARNKNYIAVPRWDLNSLPNISAESKIEEERTVQSSGVVDGS